MGYLNYMRGMYDERDSPRVKKGWDGNVLLSFSGAFRIACPVDLVWRYHKVYTLRGVCTPFLISVFCFRSNAACTLPDPSQYPHKFVPTSVCVRSLPICIMSECCLPVARVYSMPSLLTRLHPSLAQRVHPCLSCPRPGRRSW